MGVELTNNFKHREMWRPVFEPTGGGPSGWGSAGSQLAVILGKRGGGVDNDKHMTVFFYHLHGRKVWSFSKHYRWDFTEFAEDEVER